MSVHRLYRCLALFPGRLLTCLLGALLLLPMPLAASGADHDGPVLLLPTRGQRTDCGDVLARHGLRPPELEFLFCRKEGQGQTARHVARYRVKGERAAAVEALLHGSTGMRPLERILGIWSLPDGGEGRLPAGDGPSGSVSMGEVPQPGTFAAERSQWAQIAWFAVRVTLDVAEGADSADEKADAIRH